MLKLFPIFFSASLLLMVIGCRKQVSTLQDIPVNTVKDTAATQQVNPFEGIDTSDEVSFEEADLASEIAEKVRQNLQTVYFDFNSYLLNNDAVNKLNIAAKFLTENAGIRILIQGHCDERGSSEYNMGLGERRARAVKEYFLNYGLQPIRFEITSLGKEQPIVSFCSDEPCHNKNRRAEFLVLAK